MRALHISALSSAAAHTVSCDLAYLRLRPNDRSCGEKSMSKGMDRKKEGKKKPAKSLEEKRAAKREKKASRG